MRQGKPPPTQEGNEVTNRTTRCMVLFWNYRGFPWNKRVSNNTFIQDTHIVSPGETWESKICRIPNIPGFALHIVYQKQIGKRGQGGLACMVQERLTDRIIVYGDDKYKRFIWPRIEHSDCPTYIASCYTALRVTVTVRIPWP